MKNLLIISIFFLLAGCMKTRTYEDITNFSLITVEDYGCVERNTYYTEFNYTNEIFTILYSDGHNLNYVELTKNDFYSFYDSLILFKPLELKENYEYEERQSTADGLGRMKIVLNDSITKSIRYTAMPFDETEFGNFHYWLFNKRRTLDTTLNFTTLIESDFYNNQYISNWAVLNSIERNKSNFSINDILNTIDTTTNQKLKEAMISSLAFFKDRRIIDVLGPMLLSDLDKDKRENWWPYTMLELSPILAQDSSEQKTKYLKLFLKSKNGIVRTESAKALANYGITEGLKPLLDTIKNYLYGSEYSVMKEELFALTKVINDSAFIELKDYYNSAKNIEKSWRLNYVIATLNIILSEKNMEFDEFERYIRYINIDKEIIKLDKKLQAITRAHK